MGTPVHVLMMFWITVLETILQNFSKIALKKLLRNASKTFLENFYEREESVHKAICGKFGFIIIFRKKSFLKCFKNVFPKRVFESTEIRRIDASRNVYTTFYCE